MSKRNRKKENHVEVPQIGEPLENPNFVTPTALADPNFAAPVDLTDPKNYGVGPVPGVTPPVLPSDTEQF